MDGRPALMLMNVHNADTSTFTAKQGTKEIIK
jgi:hypothetical protein